ncbi:hypothetical protein BX661DRAFT_171587 [Kickxella alabastrina]|uniref:uncharacterized protein n=1 Tax=Kickxella alabastrina TaxID=61397 RepID=UPI002220A40C|nr:uncharacterized protein BX661DRAFT_171587 [Kickxella alabastrina]KAI7826307.1 hypothetical protein BX661DRAFT_171587 [Kickxella alabastrina]KAJ1934342.1 hypothetical protein GGF37_006398 [Kickxella alabastrina]
MNIDALTEQRSLMDSAHASLKHSTDMRQAKTILDRTAQTRAHRQQVLDKQQETLQLLSRRLQGARARVDSAKSQRQAKSHAETMREMHLEKQALSLAVEAQAALRQELGERVSGLEAKEVEGAEEVGEPEDVLRLMVYRGLGVEPMVEGGNVAAVRCVGEQVGAAVVGVDASADAGALAAQLWSMCS